MLQHLRAETVDEVIRLARANEIPVSEDDDGIDLTSLVEVGLVMTPTERALLDFLEALSRDEMVELMALTWLGRGSGGETREDFAGLVQHARIVSEDAAEYVAGKAPLADYLEAGIAKLNA